VKIGTAADQFAPPLMLEEAKTPLLLVNMEPPGLDAMKV
jgi:hypothetical protein